MLRNRLHTPVLPAAGGGNSTLPPLIQIGDRRDMATKMLIAWVLVAVATVSAAPAVGTDHRNAQVLRYDLDTNELPNFYRFSYDTSDGQSRTEEGQINDLGTPEAALHVFGSTRWVTDEGAVYEMSYKAGKRGYRTIIKKIS